MSPLRAFLGSIRGFGAPVIVKPSFSCSSRRREAIGQSRYQQPRTALSSSTPVNTHIRTIVTASQRLPTVLPKHSRSTLPTSLSFSTNHIRLSPPLSIQPPPSHPSRQPAPSSQQPPSLALNSDAPSASTDEKSQAKTDWKIILKLAENIWPRGSPRTKVRVVGALGLLVAGKVLNVQVPFFFKEIVDAMNVPITAGSTVWVLAGASIAGCM